MTYEEQPRDGTGEIPAPGADENGHRELPPKEQAPVSGSAPHQASNESPWWPPVSQPSAPEPPPTPSSAGNGTSWWPPSSQPSTPAQPPMWAQQPPTGDTAAGQTPPSTSPTGSTEPPLWPAQPQPGWPPAPQPGWPPAQQPWGMDPGSPPPTPPWAAPLPRRSRIERSSRTLLGIVAAALLAFGGGILLGRASFAAGSSGGAPNASLSGFDVYQQALSIVKSHYVNRATVDDKTLVYGSIQGMIDALGDTGHSRFLTPEQYQSQQQQLNSQITGIGIVGGDLNGGPSVVRVLPDSPAAKAGLKAGDQIVAVEGTPTSGLTFDQIVDKIRGPAGSTVTLSILHLGATTPIDVKITRAVISVPLVSWEMVPGTTIADIVLTGFDDGAAKQLRAAISDAQAKGATKLILDLRGNPGGYVSEAISVASIFLDSGNVYLEVDDAGKKTEVPVDTKAEHISTPLVVLIDNNTASAAEIVSGALQDANRAKLVGVRTFGTGTVLRPYQLTDGSAIYLGVSKFLTPTGKQIFGNGISPTDEVALPLGTAPANPSDLTGMTSAQFQAIKDAQLLAAVKLLQ